MRLSCSLSAATIAGLLLPPLLASQEPVYRTEELASGLKAPWSLAFLPNGGVLIVEKHGAVRFFDGTALQPSAVAGAPDNVLRAKDGGLLDIALDPDFAANHQVYLSFAEGTVDANHTALYRARFDGRALVGGRVIFRVSPDKKGTGHFGSRLAFLRDSTLLMTVGEGYDFRDSAQALSSQLGKVLRLTRDGAPAPNNPFAGRGDVRPEIYSYGHRNPQGLLVDSRTGEIWEHEHGPRGGDEINLIKAGGNYGWPLATYGIDYNGTLITGVQEAKEFEGPRVIWVPSIAPSGFALYLGSAFPQWRGDFFVGALAGKQLRRVRLSNGKPVLQETMLGELDARIRDVRVGPDGFLYVLTDDEANGKLLRIRPR